MVRGDGELQVVTGVALVARDDGDARTRMALEPLAARPPPKAQPQKQRGAGYDLKNGGRRGSRMSP